MSSPSERITFQGRLGAYSHMACQAAFPDLAPLPSESFEDAFDAVSKGKVDRALIPIDNSVAGRVAGMHQLIPGSGLRITGEHFQRVNHCLLGVKGASLGTIKTVHSHIHALNQCRMMIQRLRLERSVHADTAGAAADIAQAGDPTQASISSSLAADIYDLDILMHDLEDAEHNTTRFVVMERQQRLPEPGSGPCITSIIFNVRNLAAALYKALGGFATHGVNMIKLESYVDSNFDQAQFYAEIVGHQMDEHVMAAFEELNFFSSSVEILGTYPAATFRNLS